MSATRLPGTELPAAARADADARREAAKGLEAYLLRQVFGALTKNGGGLGLSGESFAGGTFGEMLTSALADAVVEGGGLGIAAALGPDLEAAKLDALRPLEASLGGPRPTALPLGAATRAKTAYGAAAGHALTARPLDGTITSRFGPRSDPMTGAEQHHHGLDIAAPEGTPVRCAGAGVVLRAEVEPGYGNVVVVDHGDGLETRYAHLSAIDVRAGERVQAGAELGRVGSTGKSTGPHLHFEVRRAGRSVDPATALSPLARLR